MDQAEAADIVEEHSKTHSREQLFDGVLIPALAHARRDRELERLTEDGEQFVLRATREILEDLSYLNPQNSSAVSDVSRLAAGDENLPASVPKIRILGCPAQDETDELALLMLRQLLEGTKYEVEIMTDAMLAGEVLARIGETSPAVICLAAVAPGGLAQTRYLCKRLRAGFPNLKIAVGRWGVGSKDNDAILLAGADKVGTTTIETREQVIQLCQIDSHAVAQSVHTPTANPRIDAFADISGIRDNI
jgi:CheY-like chemotaxis protein